MSEAGPGHNTIAGDKLRQHIERIERMNADISAMQTDKSELFRAAKGEGFDVKTMKNLIKLRAQDDATRQEQDALLDAYKHALGME